MAEEVGDTGAGFRESLRESASGLRKEASRDKLESRFDEALNERPLARHLLDLRIVVRALIIAAVLCLIVSLLLSPKLGALVLVAGYIAAWMILATRQYNERKPTKPAGADED
jgi:hypothetical protein